MNKRLFLETMLVMNGHFVNPAPHLLRISETLAEAGVQRPVLPVLEDGIIPADKQQGRVKCRYVYNTVGGEMEFQSYTPRQVSSLKLIEDNFIDYHLKYADRQALNALLARREGCDDILIVKNGEITDSSYSNVVLFDGKNYVIPRSYLLNGTRRQQLLANGTAKEAVVTPGDLKRFQCLYLINAMLDIRDNIRIEVKNIL